MLELEKLKIEIKRKQEQQEKVQTNVNQLTNKLLSYEIEVENKEKFFEGTEKNSLLVNELSIELKNKKEEIHTLKSKNKSLEIELASLESENWLKTIKRKLFK